MNSTSNLNIAEIIQIIVDLLNALAIIVGALWVFYRFHTTEKPKNIREKESEKQLKPTFNFSLKITPQLIDSFKFLAIELSIKNMGSKIGIISNESITIFPIYFIDGAPKQNEEEAQACINLDSNNSEFMLYPNEIFTACFLSPSISVNNSLYLIKVITIGTLMQENVKSAEEKSEWSHCELFSFA
jgi:archaellum component FlaG (FlaF/FlaG flagellin family)